jgi:type VI protein secretion system component Hcp
MRSTIWGRPGASDAERVSFTFRQITWTWVEGGKTAHDDWDAR